MSIPGNMNEPLCAQYAVQLAMQTLKERCRVLQQRVLSLEEENLSLRVQSNRENTRDTSLSEIDRLGQQVAELSEQKLQLANKVKMVTTENQELWAKLSKLSHVNQNLGSKLHIINDSIMQYTGKGGEPHSPLIRSKTFTQDEPHTKVLQKNLEENSKICSDLEEISLKIISSFAHEKSELDSLCAEILDTQCTDHVISDSFGFYYDFDNNILEQFDTILLELQSTKEAVVSQKAALQLAVIKLDKIQELKKRQSDTRKRKDMFDQSTITEPESKSIKPETPIPQIEPPIQTPVTSPKVPAESMVMICPVCCKHYNSAVSFNTFQNHVESHFQDESFEVL